MYTQRFSINQNKFNLILYLFSTGANMNIKDQILKLKQEIEFLENDVNRLGCMEQAVKIVLNGKSQ